MGRIFNIFICAVAAIVVATSCMDSDHIWSVNEKSVEITFTANLSNKMSSSRNFGDGSTVDEVAWAIYENGTIATDLTIHRGTLKLVDQSASFNATLVLGHTYDIAFFAYKADGEAVEQVGRAANAKNFNVLFEEKKLSLKSNTLKANDEELDCFWFVEEGLTVIKPLQESKKFTLVRPMAQLSFAAEDVDIQGALASGFSISDTALSATVYTEFDIFEGKVIKESAAKVEFARTDSPIDNPKEVVVTSNNNKSYKLLATTYLFANKEDLSSSIELYTWDQAGDYLWNISCDTAPIRRNYRTFLVGNLLTNVAKFEILIEGGYDEPNNNYSPAE